MVMSQETASARLGDRTDCGSLRSREKGRLLAQRERRSGQHMKRRQQPHHLGSCNPWDPIYITIGCTHAHHHCKTPIQFLARITQEFAKTHGKPVSCFISGLHRFLKPTAAWKQELRRAGNLGREKSLQLSQTLQGEADIFFFFSSLFLLLFTFGFLVLLSDHPSMFA